MGLMEAALAYGNRGWAVFPLFGAMEHGCRCGRPDCPRPGKHPLVAKGLHEATTDAGRIAAWWHRWPWANIGLATGAASGIVVIDVDQPGGEGSLRLLEDQLGPLPETLQAVTGGGGRHLYYARPGALRNSAGRLPGCEVPLADIDLRADGGALVAPPSRHVSGALYRWVDATVAVAAAPSWLREPARPTNVLPGEHRGPGTDTGYGRAALRREIEALARSEGGGRNHALNRAAFSLGTLIAGGELSEALVHEELSAAAHAIGLGDIEAERTISSGLQEGMRRPRAAPHRTRGSG